MAEDRFKIWLIIGVLVGVLILGFYYRQITLEEKKEIRVGVLTLSSGNENSNNETIKKAIQLAARDYDQDIEIIYKNTTCGDENVSAKVNELIRLSRVSAIIEGVCPKTTLAVAPITEQNHVVLISTSSTTPPVITNEGYVFRTVPTDSLKGEFGADLVTNRNFTKLAILYTNEEYAEEFKSGLERRFPGKIVSTQLFEHRTTDTKVQVSKIKTARPDSVYIISNSPIASVTALKQLKEAKVKAAVFGSEGLLDPTVLENATLTEGLTILSPATGSTSFTTEYLSMYREQPGPFAAQAYDAFSAIAKSVGEYNVTNKEELKTALQNIDFQGASGRIKFDKDGNVPANYAAYQIQDGWLSRII